MINVPSPETQACITPSRSSSSLPLSSSDPLGTLGIHLSQPGMFETLPNPEAQNLPCLDLLTCPRTHADLLTSCVGHNHLMTFPRSPGEMLSGESALENC